MDMQNVSNLQTPEGAVRTIHDKDNRLIWSRLAYDTKYAGDTVQDGTPTPDASVPVQVVTGEQTVRVNGENLFDKNNINLINAYIDPTSLVIVSDSYNKIFYIPCQPNTNYHFVQGPSSVPNHIFHVATTSVLPAVGVETSNFVVASTGGPADYLAASDAKYLVMRIRSGDDTATFWDGVSISESQSYTVDLGSTELCKIGNYQDYIYKSGDDWYVHKELGSYMATGSEDVSISSTSPAKMIYIPNDEALQGQNNTLLSTHFIYAWTNNVGVCYVSSSNHRIACGVSGVDTISAAQSWLSSNHPKFVYILATPTDTKITDATLIGQLNAVHEWLTRYGYNATVSGNLPIIIDRTNL